MQEILGVDFLSPAVAAMLYPDFLQRFIPFPIPYFDRGSWLEKAWEKAWRETAAKEGGKATNRLAEPFLDLWQKKSVAYVPALFLNGTSVEVGNRLIASNLLIDNNFLDAEDATGKLLPEKHHDERRHPQIDMPLSTTAHNSARFTYVSPAGRFDEDGSHVVDGGYFENSGAATALDMLREINRELCADKNHTLGVIVPKVIMISNDPLGIASGSRKISQAKSTLREANQHKPGTFLEDALAPLYTFIFYSGSARFLCPKGHQHRARPSLRDNRSFASPGSKGADGRLLFQPRSRDPPSPLGLDAFQRRRQSDAGRDE